MDEKKRKNLILLSVIIIIVLVLFLIFKAKSLNSQDGTKVKDEVIYSNEQEGNQGTVSLLETRSEMYMARRVVQKYYTYSKYLSENPDSEENKKNLYNVFCKCYVDKYNVTVENVNTKASTSDCDTVYIDEIYRVEFIGKPYIYFVKGLAINMQNQKKEKFNVAVMIDKNTEKAGIILEDYISELNYSDIKAGDKVTLIQDSLENDNNYYIEYISELDYVQDMFNEFKQLCVYYPEEAYLKLTDNMKQQFKDENQFISYINENKTKILVSSFGAYDKNQDQYKCITEDGKAYNFITNGIGNYKVEFEI